MMSTIGDESPFCFNKKVKRLSKWLKWQKNKQVKKLLFQLVFSTYLLVHQHHILTRISHFSWSGVVQKYAEWVVVGCRIDFPIQRLLLFEIWVKPHGYMLKIRVKRVVFHFLIIFYLFTFLLNFFTILL